MKVLFEYLFYLRVCDTISKNNLNLFKNFLLKMIERLSKHIFNTKIDRFFANLKRFKDIYELLRTNEITIHFLDHLNNFGFDFSKLCFN